MTRYFILIKRKNSKQWLGAIPAKKNASLSQLQKIKTKPGFVRKVISEPQLKRLLTRIKPRVRRRKTTVTRRKKRMTRKKPVRRRKVTRKKKR